jgi:hypothetical protein
MILVFVLLSMRTPNCCVSAFLAVNIMDKIDESCWSICQPKGHDGVHLFDGIGALEGQPLLTGESNS